MLPRRLGEHESLGGRAVIRVHAEPSADADGASEPESEAVDFVRFCYRRRSVVWPELYDEMCAVAARGEYRGMDYEQLERIGVRFVLAALPRLAEMAARVVAEERGPQVPAVAQPGPALPAVAVA